MSQQTAPVRPLVICGRHDAYPASLEVRKVYEVRPAPLAAAHRRVRVIDESGEDYLSPADYFLPVDLPPPLRAALHLAA
jgi:hypothetical protein